MKTRTWIILLAAVLIVSAGLSAALLTGGGTARQVEVWSQGQKKYTLSLQQDQTVSVESSLGTNVITIRNGKVAVTETDCPDHYCMRRGYCDGGADIVCLPNGLVIKFVQRQEIDAAVG